MNIFPQDLGTRRHVELVYARAYKQTNGNGGTQQTVPALERLPRPRLGRLGRFWARGSDLSPVQAAAALPAAGSGLQTHLYLWPSLWAFLSGLVPLLATLNGEVGADTAALLGAAWAASTAAITYGGARIGRWLFDKVHRDPLTLAEVEALPTGHDDVERAYLQLVIHAIRQNVPPEAETDVRSTLRALGEAVARLPAVPPIEDESHDLRAQADSLRAQAASEPDAIIAESLARQAESLLRRAATVERSALLVRRAVVVRRELSTQIRTLGASLAACSVGAGDVGDLAGLAETVRAVASEADNIARARQELDQAVADVPNATTAPPAVNVPVTPAAAEVPGQVLQNRR